MESLAERILARLEEGRRTELFCGVEADGSRAWAETGGDVLLRAGRWQQRLRLAGVRPGDRVGIDLERGPDLLAAHVAALAAGACVVPLNPAQSAAERQKLVSRARLATLLDEPDTPSAGALELATPPTDGAALLIFTSGTTGAPKGVPHSLATLESNLAALETTWQLAPRERLLHALPAHHVHGLVLALYGSARLGMPIVMLRRFDPERVLRTLESERVNVFMGVPTMYHRMNGSSTTPDLGSMRLFVSGSAPLAARDFHAFEQRFGFVPVERYGLSETLIVTSNSFDGERRPGIVGRALPGTELRLAADGEILVRGPGVMSGYWEDEAATLDAFVDGFFRTGDLGRLHPNGDLEISGRKKELIIVGGSNVLPGEVEAALSDVPGLDEVAVAGLPDPDRGEVVAAFYVPAPGADTGDVERALRASAESRLSSYKRPRHYQALASLPRNAMGKLDRKQLSGRTRGA